MMFTRFWALFKARLLEFFRDKSALVWSFIFPLALVCCFGFMFGSGDSMLYKVGVVGKAQDSVFTEVKHLQFVEYDDQQNALLKLSQHSLDLLVDFKAKQYWVNSESPKGYIVERLLLHSEPDYKREVYSGRQIRHVDWLLPGILGMNVMFGCFYGIGYAIVRYRRNSVLKRLQATPLNAVEFLLAQIASRLLIVLVTISLVFIICHSIFDIYMIGSYLRLLFMLILGGLSMIAMSLIIAARWESEELTNGLLNFLSWPMMLLSGVWFSLEGAPDFVQTLANFLPLTHMIDGMRDIMFHDADLWQLRFHIGALSVMTVVFFAIGASLFRWNGNGR